MDLWVRSQSKTKLLKVDNLELITNQFGHCIFASSGNKEYCIGKYSSFDRTIEILDEIRMMLSPKLHTIFTKDGLNVELLDKKYDVYEMPIE